jgi:nucleoside-diphosphate-sugar epimerase
VRIFVAGATGVIGRQLVPMLVAEGHTVAGMTRSPEKAAEVRSLGAEPVVCDVYAAEALAEAVHGFEPELVMHQLTDLPDELDRLPEFRDRNDRMRTQGTRNLIAAAQAARVKRLLAQSISWEPAGGGEAVEEHERMVLDAGGVVVRYGQLYGPGTYHEDDLPEPPRIHVEQAARRTVELLDAGSGAIVLTDQVEP